MGREGQPVAELLPRPLTLDGARTAAAGCRACELWRVGTRTVFGEGTPPCAIMLVGEQPGDREDLEGRPFVGPAGELLDRALGEAGLDRGTVYVTNAVKHFRWVRQGRRRLGRKPGVSHILACRPWLQAEVELVRPGLIVLLGAVAARSVLDREVRVLEQRGRIHPSPLGPPAMITVHPSSVLRSPDPQSRERSYLDLVADLSGAARWIRPDRTP
ncbi:MAG TPA: UdgX family uracil-DNA binding protein [Candidatus Dormibacteraeota bacterium]|nr:UdgX family uracil-DNA binding protein [Candidatus Dormibacteraeota bacterium]